MTDIMKWNNLSKDTIYVAQKLEIQKLATNDSKKSFSSINNRKAANNYFSHSSEG
ncbi:hypothetical protein OL548_09610 [Lysinibacillus sp. MHQ-1]|nr:hypothetical protein OL548_09610 [Lysinibacillus sp. MHQ-1]